MNEGDVEIFEQLRYEMRLLKIENEDLRADRRRNEKYIEEMEKWNKKLKKRIQELETDRAEAKNALEIAVEALEFYQHHASWLSAGRYENLEIIKDDLSEDEDRYGVRCAGRRASAALEKIKEHQ